MSHNKANVCSMSCLKCILKPILVYTSMQFQGPYSDRQSIEWKNIW